MKKIFVIVLLVVFAMSLFTGCEKKQETAIQQQTTQETKPVQPTAEIKPASTESKPAITPTTESTPTPVVKSIPKETLILEPELWKNASIPYCLDNSRFDGIGFSNIPVGTKIFSPFDGEIMKTQDVIVLREKNNGMYQIYLYLASNIKLDESRQTILIKKGELIGTLESTDILFTDTFKNSDYNFVVGVSDKLYKQITNPSDDPVEYMNQLFDVMKN